MGLGKCFPFCIVSLETCEFYDKKFESILLIKLLAF